MPEGPTSQEYGTPRKQTKEEKQQLAVIHVDGITVQNEHHEEHRRAAIAVRCTADLLTLPSIPVVAF